MFFVLSKLLDIAFSPLTWGLLLLAAAVPWRASAMRQWKRRRLLGAAGLATLLVASSSVASNTVGWSLEHSATSTYRDDVVYDAVVLLGGVTDEEVTAISAQPAYNESVERLVMTQRLLRDGRARSVIISGGTMDPRFEAHGEAVELGRQLEEWGIAKDRIVLEPRARNTHENAVYAQEIAKARGWERVLIVTSAFHMRRAAECFAGVGMKVDTFAVDYRAHEHSGGLADYLPRAQALATTSMMLREWFGRIVYRVQGYGKAP